MGGALGAQLRKLFDEVSTAKRGGKVVSRRLRTRPSSCAGPCSSSVLSALCVHGITWSRVHASRVRVNVFFFVSVRCVNRVPRVGLLDRTPCLRAQLRNVQLLSVSLRIAVGARYCQAALENATYSSHILQKSIDV